MTESLVYFIYMEKYSIEYKNFVIRKIALYKKIWEFQYNKEQIQKNMKNYVKIRKIAKELQNYRNIYVHFMIN